MNTLSNILWISIIQIILTEISATSFLPITSRSQQDSDLTFPEEETIPSADESIPRCAQGSTFCETVDDYPTAYVDFILEKDAHKYEGLFETESETEEPLLYNRFGSDGSDGFVEFEEYDVEESLCRSRERLIYPRAGLTVDNTWMYIVNQNNYTQSVRVDECIHTNRCEMTQNFPLGYDAICKQKYIYRQLVAINKDGYTVKDLFRLPSCCQCVLIQRKRKQRSLH